MLKKLTISALAAGFGAGLLVAVLHVSLLSPMILEAEAYETGEQTHFAGVMNMVEADHNDNHDHDDGEVTAAQSDGASDIENLAIRGLRTALSSTLTFLGFAFVMVAGFGVAAQNGIEISARSGLIWGVMGFFAVALAPAMGLPPELPASAAAPLQERQLWWFGAVIASTAGIAAIAFGKNWAHWGAGVVLLALPHVIGAPHPVEFGGVVPPELQGDFVGLSLGVSAIGWALLGLIGGYAWARQD